MSLPEIKTELEALRNNIEEIVRLLQQNSKSEFEAVAAKIISEIKTEINNCPCNKEIIDAIVENSLIPIVPFSPKEKDPISKLNHGFGKYSYPNFNVGNENLGSSGNPNALKWPYGSK